MDKFFNHLDYQVTDALMGALRNRIETASESEWGSLFNFERLLVHWDLMKLDPVLNDLVDKYAAWQRLSIFRSKPNSVYDWHIDGSRNASVNVLISHTNSLCLYATANPYGPHTELTVLEYKDKTPCVLNTKKMHSILNFEGYRYILSIGIPPIYTYDDVISYLKQPKTA